MKVVQRKERNFDWCVRERERGFVLGEPRKEHVVSVCVNKY